MDSIENDLKRIYDHYRKVVNENEYLRKENDRLKSEAYKDEELSKMKEKYDQMSKDYYRGFPISEEEEKKINEWIEKQIEKHPSGRSTIGGRFTYEFFPRFRAANHAGNYFSISINRLKKFSRKNFAEYKKSYAVLCRRE